MIFSVYGRGRRVVDGQAPGRIQASTASDSGYRHRTTVPPPRTTTDAVATNAHPSPRRPTPASPHRVGPPPRRPERSRSTSLPWASWVQMPEDRNGQHVTGRASRRRSGGRRRGPHRRSSSATKTAPWNSEQAGGGEPAQECIRIEHVAERQDASGGGVHRQAAHEDANATPHSTAGHPGPDRDADVGPARATAGRRSCRAIRSRTTRTIIANRITSNGRYSAGEQRRVPCRGTRRTSHRRR